MEITIISEETVRVLDRHVRPGAGTWAVRCLFVVIVGVAASVVVAGVSVAWRLAVWIDSPEAVQAVRSISAGRALTTLLLIFVVVFLIGSGAYTAAASLRGLAWAWGHARVARTEIIHVWSGASLVERLSFAILALFVVATILGAYAAVFVIIWHGGKLL